MSLRKFLDKIKPNFEEGGKLHWLYSTYDAFETFLYVPNTTSKSGVHIHDARDSKRTMVIVILALIPALLMGMYNVGYQHYLAINEQVGIFATFLYGFLATLPHIVVSYAVGLGIEFAMAQVKKEEVAEGFLVSGLLIPMILPVDTPLWMIAVATAFAVIFAKEVFGGTGYNIFNVALMARAFLFFAYPSNSAWTTCRNGCFGFQRFRFPRHHGQGSIGLGHVCRINSRLYRRSFHVGNSAGRYLVDNNKCGQLENHALRIFGRISYRCSS